MISKQDQYYLLLQKTNKVFSVFDENRASYLHQQFYDLVYEDEHKAKIERIIKYLDTVYMNIQGEINEKIVLLFQKILEKLILPPGKIELPTLGFED